MAFHGWYLGSVPGRMLGVGRRPAAGETVMLFLLLGILVTVIVGAICFYLIDRFVRDGRLANLLKILVVLLCLIAILQRLLPALGIGWL